MKRFIPVLLLLASLLLASCASPAPSALVNVPKIDNQGAVTVTVTPLNLDKPGEILDFDVSMSTHSVELGMDLTTLSTLTTDTGVSISPSQWDGPVGGHHVEGTLSFPATKDGKSILEGAKNLTLTITGVDNATRTLTWDLSAK